MKMGFKILFVPHLLGWRTAEDTGFFHIIRDLSLSEELLKIDPSVDIAFMVPGFRASFVESKGFKVIRTPVVTFHHKVEDFHVFFDYLYLTARKFNPDVVIGDMFPYASALAEFLNRPFILIADYVFPLGDVNVLARFFSLRVSKVLVCDTEPFWPVPKMLESIKNKMHFVGPILRQFNELRSKSKRDIKAELGFNPESPLILVTMGGSGLFSKPFKVAIEAFREVRKKIHNAVMLLCLGLTPKEKVAPIPEEVVIKSFISDLAPLIRASDVIVTRGGHGTLAEASVLATPIIVTNMYEPVRRQEELYNIRRFKFIGNVVFIPASDFTPKRLAFELERILSNDEFREKLVKAGLSIPTDGRVKAANLIYELLKKS